MGCGGSSKVHDLVDVNDTVDVNEPEDDGEVFPNIAPDESRMMVPESTIVRQRIMGPVTINIIDSQVTIVGGRISASGMVLSGEVVGVQQLTPQEQIPDGSFAAAEEQAIADQVYRSSVVGITAESSDLRIADQAPTDTSGNSAEITSLRSTAIEKKGLVDSSITEQLPKVAIDDNLLLEHGPDKPAVQIIGSHVISTARSASYSLKFSDGKIKPLTPEGYPSALDLEHPWDYESSLYYSSEWQNKGSYKLLPLQAEQKDFEFVSKLFANSVGELGDGYEISDITLLSDEGDEQAFVAELDLLEKKHGNLVHNAKWKRKNQSAEQKKKESEELVGTRKEIRTKLKSLRYRTQNVPHVKLLPLWHGTTIKKIAELKGASFSDLSYVNQGEIGKGYYGKASAIDAYNEAFNQHKDEQLILMLSWYAGKTVYPTTGTDQLTGQPHYANHDLHYRVTAPDHHTAVVFDPGQILPRYLVSIKKRGTVNLGIKKKLQIIPYADPGKRPLLFQANFTHTIATIAKERFAIMQAWLADGLSALTTNSLGSINEHDYYQKIITDFVIDQTKEVLLLKTFDSDDGELLARFLEMSLWDSYEEGKPIPLHLELAKFSHLEKRDLIEDSLTAGAATSQAIKDLKDQRKEFTFIFSGYEQITRIPLVKSNHLNRPGGFKGKTIIIVSQNFPDSENSLFYPEGGTNKQQSDRLKIIPNLPKLSQQAAVRCYISNKLAANRHKSLLAEESYYAATQLPHQLAPTPGGELKPWEYSNGLQHSYKWQNKGAFKIHSLQPSDPDYDFVAKLYAQTTMPGYELDEVYVISDRGAEQAFVANLNTLERGATKPEHQPSWDREDQEASRTRLRAKSIVRLEQKSYKTLLTQSVKLLPLWHGTGPAAAAGIAKSGFASLALVDAGYFGKGLYGSSSAEYSYRVYGKGTGVEGAPGYGDDGLLILSWYSAQNVYPVIKWDTCPEDKLKGKPNYKNYDSHFVRVKPGNRHKHEEGIEDCYYPIGEDEEQEETYQEFVTFPTAQVLPRYILSLRDIKSKQRLPGMSKFLETAESSGNTSLYEQSLTGMVEALRQSAKSEIEQDYMLTQGLSLYIPSQATNSDKIDNVNEQDQYQLELKAEEFITTSTKELWLIQGNAGSGKSLFGRYLERKLWSEYKGSDLIPLFIPLPRIGDLSPVEDLIANALKLKGISLYAISKLKAEKRFLFILDGYDEIPGKPKLLQKYKFNEPGFWQGKIIVGCRLQHLTATEEQLLYPKHAGDNLTQSIERCMKSYIIPFNPKQIESYIAGFCDSKFNKNDDGTDKWQITQYQEKIAEFKEISEFLKEPFLLFLVLSVLPHLSEKFAYSKTRTKVETKASDKTEFTNAESLVEFVSSSTTIKKIDLYDSFTESWFKSQFERMTQHYVRDLCDYSQEKLLDIFRNYAKKLAFKMFLEETQITIHPLDPEFGKFFIGSEGDVKSKEIAELGFQGSPLKRIGESYLFMHKSFQEYFAARKILDELKQLGNEPKISLADKIMVSLLQQKSLVSDPAILEFIASCLPNEFLQNILFNIIFSTRENAKLTQAASNAATILNTANIPFSGMDLSRVRIPRANLIGAILDYTNLESADLSGTNLKGAWLQGANLKNSNMVGTFFGEMAFISTKQEINCCAFSLNYRYFAIASGKIINIYSIKQQKNVINTTLDSTMEDHTDIVNSIAFSYDSKILVSGSNDSTIIIWYLSNISTRQIICGHTEGINSVSISFNNKFLASGSNDNTIRIWNLKDLTNVQMFAYDTPVHSVNFSPDNNSIASGGDDKTVRIWSLVDPANNKTLIGHTSIVRSVSFSSDGKLLASGSDDKTIRIWDSINFNIILTLRDHTFFVYSVAFSPDSQFLASGSRDNTVRLWSLVDPSNKKTLTGHTNFVYSVTFSPDSKFLASGSRDMTVRFWNLTDRNTSQTKLKTTDNHGGSVYSIVFSLDNRFMASGGADGIVRFWRINSHAAPENVKTLIGHTDYVRSVAFSSNNKWLASGSHDKTICIWNINDPDNPVHDKTLIGDTRGITSITFSFDCQWLISGGWDSIVRIWNLINPDNNQIITHTKYVNSVIFSPNNKWLASGGADNIIFLWSIMPTANSLLDLTKTKSLIGHTKAIYSLTFSTDNQWLVSGSDDRTVRIWNLIDYNTTQVLTDHTNDVDGVSFSSNSEWLISGSMDGTVIFWNKKSASLLSPVWTKVFTLKTNFNVYTIAYLPSPVNDHLLLAVGGNDFSSRIFEQHSDKITLRWTTCQTVLCATQANINGTRLSKNNSELLKQCSAEGIPIILDDDIEGILEEEQVTKVQLNETQSKLLLFSEPLTQSTLIEETKKTEGGPMSEEHWVCNKFVVWGGMHSPRQSSHL